MRHDPHFHIHPSHPNNGLFNLIPKRVIQFSDVKQTYAQYKTLTVRAGFAFNFPTGIFLFSSIFPRYEFVMCSFRRASRHSHDIHHISIHAGLYIPREKKVQDGWMEVFPGRKIYFISPKSNFPFANFAVDFALLLLSRCLLSRFFSINQSIFVLF